MLIPGEVLAEREAIDEELDFSARVVQRYVSHVLSFPQMLPYSPPKEKLNMQYYTTWRQCLAFCILNHPLFP